MDALTNLEITPKLLRRIAEIDEFKGRWEALGRIAPERLSALRRVATIESTGSSTRIEGSKLSDAEVERVLSGLALASFASRDEQEVAGYGTLMELIFESWRELDLSENHLKQLHGVLLKSSEKDARHRGEYKKFPNSVEAFGPAGESLGVVFETASPFDTPRLMQALVAETGAAFSAKEHHPLLIIAAFIVRFLAIHPFQDGNGRLSRALSTLLLLRNGYAYAPYASLERVVEENKAGYYKALRAAQAGERFDAWAVFFLDCLAAQKNALTEKLEREAAIAALPALAARLVALARERGRITVAEAVKATGANRNTIKVHLRRLSAQGRLIAKGTGRGTWYAAA